MADYLLEFTSQTPVPVANAYHTPETLGRDRLAAAVGATVLYRAQRADRRFRHGRHDRPGDGRRTRSAAGAFRRDENPFSGAPRLHGAACRCAADRKRGSCRGSPPKRPSAWGVMNSLTFEIEGYMARMEKKIDDLCVIFTGGDAKYFAKRIKNTIFANCNLVFCGLDRILEYNASEEHLD